jgi:hypothetical protein
VDDPWNAPPPDRLPLDDPDFRLLWPRDLFVSELDVVIGRYEAQGTAAGLLMEEAFAGSSPADQAQIGVGDARALVHELRRRAAELRENDARRAPYFMQRAERPATVTTPDWNNAQRRFRTTIKTLDARGYFDRAWGPDCVDNARSWRAPIDDIEAELGVADVDPFGPATVAWDQELFLSVVEVLHDRVARPRIITRFHDFNECGRHYGDYAPAPGQAVYRLQVNRIFEQAHLPFRLSGTGEDHGRVVAYQDDATEDLMAEVVATARPAERDELAHAITTFRARTADRDAKRSAVLTLARILEQHRPLLKAELLSADENALFQIANQFDIRHRNDKQLDDYDVAFLDWVFWTYLASIRLLRHLLSRTPATP